MRSVAYWGFRLPAGRGIFASPPAIQYRLYSWAGPTGK
jgi:hypothetical protein